MARVVAVTEHSPEQVYSYLRACGECKHVTYLPESGLLDPEGKYRPHIFIIGTDTYSKNAVTIREMPEEYEIFIFGHRRILERYGLNVGLTLPEMVGQRAKLTPVGTYTKALCKKAASDSLFHDLMTWIYKLPSKTHQKPVTNEICKWIYTGEDINVNDMVDRIPVKLKPLQKHELCTILNKPVTNRLRQAFADLRNGVVQTKGQTLVRNDVQTFEYSYIEGNIKKTANITDQYVANQGI